MEEKEPSKDALLSEWAEKIYRAAEAVWRMLVAFLIFPTKEEAEKFRNAMHGKKFGKFVSVLQSNVGLLYLKIGDYEIAADYYPSCKHIEKIANFLSEQKEKSIDVIQQILTQIATVPIVARMVRGKILYSELEKMEKKIAELKKEKEEIINQLGAVLEMGIYSNHNIESAIRQGIPLYYATRNKIKKWRNESDE